MPIYEGAVPEASEAKTTEGTLIYMTQRKTG